MVYTATVNLFQVTEDEETVWKLDREYPLAIEDPNQKRDEEHALPENDDELTAPTNEELAELIDVKGWCNHGETELDLDKVKFDVVVYKDDEDIVRARVTFKASKVAEAVTKVRRSAHRAASLVKLKTEYTLIPEDEDYGSGWSVYKDEWSNSEKNSGKTIWVLPQWTVTYTDGVDGSVFVDKTFVLPASSAEIAQNALKNGTLTTPAFGDDPVRGGYTFEGWTPEVAETLTASVIYTATWAEVDTEDPADPTDPTEPVDPTNPVDPTDPVDPVDSTDPTEPTNPAESGKENGTPVQPGEGEQTPAVPGKDEENPPVTPVSPTVTDPAPSVEEPAPDPEKDNG